MSVWSGLRTRRPISRSEYDALADKLHQYVSHRFEMIPETAVRDIVNVGLIFFLSPAYLISSRQHNTGDLFDLLDNSALAHLRAVSETVHEDQHQIETADDALVAAIFGNDTRPSQYRLALREARLSGNVREYLVVTQVVDLYVETGKMPDEIEVADRLRRYKIASSAVSAHLLSFANRIADTEQ